MSFGPQVVMPGAFHSEASSTPKDGAGSLSGVHPGIFRQPVSPSPSTSAYLGRSTGSLYSDTCTPGPNAKRKRQTIREPTPLNDWTFTGDSGFSMYNVAEGRKPDLGSRKISGGKRRYVLAGQISTPSAWPKEFGDSMEDSVYSDVDYRRALGSKRPYAEFDSPLSSKNTSADLPRQYGWSTFAIQTIGGVVSKVWEFCKEGAFRGFIAGGGKGYEIQQPPTLSEQQRHLRAAGSTGGGQVWCNEHDIPTLPSYEQVPRPTPARASSAFPQSDYSPYYYERETPESTATPPPAAKRRQIHDGRTPKDELRRNWVVVNSNNNNKNNDDDEPGAGAASNSTINTNKRPSSLASRAPTGYYNPQRPPIAAPQRRRPNNNNKPVNRLDPPGFNRRQSTQASPATAASTAREPASYASPRSSATSVAPVPQLRSQHEHEHQHQHRRSPSRIPVPVLGERPQTPRSAGDSRGSPYAPSPSRIASPSPSPYAQGGGGGGHGHRRMQSAAAASPATTTGLGLGLRKRDSAMSLEDSSPRLDREAKKLAARRLQAEREADLRINDFNARLREMIRQGKEALGTSVEVVDAVDAVDDDYDDYGDMWEDD